MRVTSELGKLALWYDYTTVCKDLRIVMDKTGVGDTVKRKVELTEPVDYTREELFKKFDPKTTVVKWDHTFTEDGQPTMAVVLADNSRWLKWSKSELKLLYDELNEKKIKSDEDIDTLDEVKEELNRRGVDV